MTQSKTRKQSCYQCEGKGYTEIRDCAGEIQRTETCSYCEGTGRRGDEVTGRRGD